MELLDKGRVLLQLEVEDGDVMGIIEAVRPVALVFIDKAVVIRILASDLRGLFCDGGCGVEILVLGFLQGALDFSELIRGGNLHEIRDLTVGVQQMVGVDLAFAVVEQLGKGGDVETLDVALGPQQLASEAGKQVLMGGNGGLVLPAGKKSAETGGEIPGGGNHVLVATSGFHQFFGHTCDLGGIPAVGWR